MTTPTDATPYPWAAIIFAVTGIALFAAGVVWPHVPATSDWSDDQARQYGRAAADYHRVQSAEASGDGQPESLLKARAEYELHRRELDAARERPALVGYWLKIGGAALICCSAALVWRRVGDK